MSTIKVDNIQTTGGVGLYPARAAVNYNGVSNTIIKSYNVSSVTDQGTAIYLVNFSAPMPDANYMMATGCIGYTTANRSGASVCYQGTYNTGADSKTTTYCGIVYTIGTGGTYDVTNIDCVFF